MGEFSADPFVCITGRGNFSTSKRGKEQIDGADLGIILAQRNDENANVMGIEVLCSLSGRVAWW